MLSINVNIGNLLILFRFSTIFEVHNGILKANKFQ